MKGDEEDSAFSFCSEQKLLTTNVKQLEAFCVKVAQTMAAKHAQAQYYSDHLKSVPQTLQLLEKTNALASKAIKSLEVLNSMLPVEERLEPISVHIPYRGEYQTSLPLPQDGGLFLPLVLLFLCEPGTTIRSLLLLIFQIPPSKILSRTSPHRKGVPPPRPLLLLLPSKGLSQFRWRRLLRPRWRRVRRRPLKRPSQPLKRRFRWRKVTKARAREVRAQEGALSTRQSRQSPENSGQTWQTRTTGKLRKRSRSWCTPPSRGRRRRRSQRRLTEL